MSWFNSYAKTSFRTLYRHKFYLGLNIFGLSLGIALGLVLFQFIVYHLDFNKHYKNADQIYKIVTEIHLPDGSMIYDAGAPLAIAGELKKTVPGVDNNSVALNVRSATVNVPGNDKMKIFTEHDNIAFTDQQWFSLFDYSWLEGSPKSSLLLPGTAVITLQVANKYFGTTDPIGKTIIIDDKHVLTITGLLKNNPVNTDLKTGVFISAASFKMFYPGVEEEMINSWGNINSTTQAFVQLSPGLQVKRAEAAMQEMVKQHFEPSVASAYHFRLLPLKEIHFDGRFGGTMRKSLLAGLALLGFFLISIACFNFINLATAQSIKRTKEFGTRKLLGGSPASLFGQFMTETSIIVVFAAIVSIVWAIIFLPVINKWLGIHLELNILGDSRLLLAFISLVIFVILASGVYPALVLSRFRPITIFKKQEGNRQSPIFRKSLIVVQNCIVQGLIASSVVIALQLNYLKTTDLGFNKEAVLMVPLHAMENNKMAYFADQLAAKPGIKSVSFCYQAPSSDASLGGSIKFDNRPWEDYTTRTIVGDHNYLSTFGLQLLAGANFKDNVVPMEVLINKTLLNKLGFSDPSQVIGHRLTIGGFDDYKSTIVGVVNDFNASSLYKPIEPLIITTKQDKYRYVAIHTVNNNQAQIRGSIGELWENVYPGYPFEYQYLDQQVAEFYQKEDLLSKLVQATTIIAIIISCLGLFGLISFIAAQRTKEIGIRKVLGAGVTQVVTLLSRDLLILLLVSIVIAAPLVWYFMHQWLAGFAYRINISWWIFPATGIMSLIIGFLAIGGQSIKTALSNPVESLRAE